MGNIRVYTLGRFLVWVDGQPLADDVWVRKEARQLFKVLLTRPRRHVLRDEATELLWPGSGPNAAAANLPLILHAVQRALGVGPGNGRAPVVLTDRESMSVRADADIWVEADAFEYTIAQAQHTSDPLLLLEEADTLYAGEYLPEDLYERWATECRDTLKRAWTELQFSLARHSDLRGDLDRAAVALHRLLSTDPGDERAAQDLMRLLAHRGRDPMRGVSISGLFRRCAIGLKPTCSRRRLTSGAAS